MFFAVLTVLLFLRLYRFVSRVPCVVVFAGCSLFLVLVLCFGIFFCWGPRFCRQS